MNHLLTRLCAAVLGLGLLAGCARDATGGPPAPAPAAASYPRTVQVPGDPAGPVTIPRRPQRIAALSADVAEAAVELAGAGRLIAVPASAANPSLSGHARAMASVATKLPPGTDPDPEQIISLNPDLILITTRHGGERDARATLARAGIPMIAIGNNWGTLEEVQRNLTLLGTALGAEAKAAELVAGLDRRARGVAEKIGRVAARPGVAILSNQAGRPFINAADVLTSDLVRRAGGEPVAARIGLRATAPVTAEQLIAARPDAILLVDVTGKGRASFESVLGNPAVAGLPAVRDGRVKLLPARISYGTGGAGIADGLDEIARWLHPGSFR
ncbi:ABC transporter substrate-binding protein [Bailinhaonella thermotolerans]|uniref:ABC transporter substrate-binding protein n=1 Tax=Bailinhaonella thermotolerans TaxID=1070861 RepID=A0A3A4BBE9_9ACTN|nr:ABC transporter substrate-binding protein [Bailinhaonella thermotolerans]RJL35426.1 ABC transporter substrate-binding protein [Bailinhaonella thermotolerans]